MPIEVEQKFHVADAAALRARIDAAGLRPSGEVTETDSYLSHPSRDLAATDEALRVRTTARADGGRSVAVTFKGPRSGGPVKTRFESEFPVLASEATALEFFEKLGFGLVRRVEKRRSLFTRDEGDADRVTVTLDDVTGLGTFSEVEVVLADGTPPGDAEQIVDRWAERLGLETPEPRSYLEMLLGRTAEDSAKK
ncbi:MAG: class IV adenylate cyclase [Planctomycetota bacterium]